jgi:hypothetical protein
MAYVAPSARRSPPAANPTTRSVGGLSAKGGRGAARRPNLAATPPAGRSGTFLTGLGIGLAVGAALALLLAPQSGAETRRALRRRGRRVRNTAGDAWEDLRIELARAKRALLRRKRREARGVDDAEAAT